MNVEIVDQLDKLLLDKSELKNNQKNILTEYLLSKEIHIKINDLINWYNQCSKDFFVDYENIFNQIDIVDDFHNDFIFDPWRNETAYVCNLKDKNDNLMITLICRHGEKNLPCNEDTAKCWSILFRCDHHFIKDIDFKVHSYWDKEKSIGRTEEQMLKQLTNFFINAISAKQKG